VNAWRGLSTSSPIVALARVAALSGVLDPLRQPVMGLAVVAKDPLSGLAGDSPVDALLAAALARGGLEPLLDDGVRGHANGSGVPQGAAPWGHAAARPAAPTSRAAAAPSGSAAAAGRLAEREPVTSGPTARRRPTGTAASAVHRPTRLDDGLASGVAAWSRPARDLAAGGSAAVAGADPTAGRRDPEAGNGELARLIALTGAPVPQGRVAGGSGDGEPRERTSGDDGRARRRPPGRPLDEPPRSGGTERTDGRSRPVLEALAGDAGPPVEAIDAAAAPSAARTGGRRPGGVEAGPLAAVRRTAPDAEPVAFWPVPDSPAAVWVIAALERELRDEARRYGIVVEDG
jgi:hypothetical protein